MESVTAQRMIITLQDTQHGVSGCQLRYPLDRLPELQARIQRAGMHAQLTGLYLHTASSGQYQALNPAWWRQLYLSPSMNRLALLPSLAWLRRSLPPTTGLGRAGARTRTYQDHQGHVLRLLVEYLLATPQPELADPEAWAGVVAFVTALEEQRQDWVGDPEQRARPLNRLQQWAA
ncbi:MAG: hypothetical protein EA401_01400 [Planctomycetota bacterium]|nr:MAG: hypothetical protein EA401_01400 [Planctomycetota bacterium]